MLSSQQLYTHPVLAKRTHTQPQPLPRLPACIMWPSVSHVTQELPHLWPTGLDCGKVGWKLRLWFHELRRGGHANQAWCLIFIILINALVGDQQGVWGRATTPCCLWVTHIYLYFVYFLPVWAHVIRSMTVRMCLDWRWCPPLSCVHRCVTMATGPLDDHSFRHIRVAVGLSLKCSHAGQERDEQTLAHIKQTWGMGGGWSESGAARGDTEKEAVFYTSMRF